MWVRPCFSNRSIQANLIVSFVTVYWWGWVVWVERWRRRCQAQQDWHVTCHVTKALIPDLTNCCLASPKVWFCEIMWRTAWEFGAQFAETSPPGSVGCFLLPRKTALRAPPPEFPSLAEAWKNAFARGWNNVFSSRKQNHLGVPRAL